jgi:hypothetical protein
MNVGLVNEDGSLAVVNEDGRWRWSSNGGHVGGTPPTSVNVGSVAQVNA